MNVNCPVNFAGTGLFSKRVRDANDESKRQSVNRFDQDMSEKKAGKMSEPKGLWDRIYKSLDPYTHGCTSWAYDFLIFAAFCRGVTWFLQQVCGAPHDLWQVLWNRFLAYFGHDEFTLIVVVTNVWTFSLYWSLGLIYMFMDVTGWPKWIRKYKVQPGTHDPVDKKRLYAALRQVLFNQLCVGVPLSMVAFPFMKQSGIRPFDELPSLNEVVRDLVVFLLVEEVAFYYAHRLLHHRWFYKRIHKIHHEYTAPMALVATYCHPIEHLVANLLPPTLGIFLMQSHLLTGWVWYSFMIVITLNDHSGYHLPFFSSPEAHDFHHLKFNQFYGSIGLLDYLHGTDKVYRSSTQYRRHFVSTALDPVSHLYPDDRSKIQ